MKKNRFTLLLALSSLTGCVSSNSFDSNFYPPYYFYQFFQRAAVQDELRSNREKWQATGVDSYEVKVSRHCAYCGLYDGFIRVSNGNIISADDYLGGDTVPLEPRYFDTFLTIDELFDYLQQEVDESTDQESIVEVIYDPDFGFPAKATITLLYETVIIDITQFDPL